MNRILAAAISLTVAGCGGSAQEAVYEGGRMIMAFASRPERVSRAHGETRPELAWIAKRLEPEVSSGSEWLSVREAEQDLDQLEFLLKGGTALQEAFDAIRSWLGKGITRREFARQIVRAIVVSGERRAVILTRGHVGPPLRAQDFERREGESEKERTERMLEAMEASMERTLRAVTPVSIAPPGSTPFAVRALPLGFAAVDPESGRALDPECPYIVAMDGKPIAEWTAAAASFAPSDRRLRIATLLEQVALLRLEAGFPASPDIRVTLGSADGSRSAERTVRLLEKPRPEDHEPRGEFLDDDVAVLRLPRLIAADRDEILDAFDDVEDARALVVDLRGNDIADARAMQLLAAFLAADTHGRVEPYRGRLALLVDGRTQGEPESLVARLQYSLPVVGTPTAGCPGPRQEHTLEFSGIGILLGEAGVAVAPQVAVYPAERDLMTGGDLMLEAAVDALAR